MPPIAATRETAVPRAYRPGWGRRATRRLLQLAVVLVLPFAVLLRGSTALYLSGLAPTWPALAGGALLALAAITLPGAWVVKHVTGRARLRAVAKWVALPIVIGYCAHALLFLSQANVKNEEVRSYYRTLHPLLRVAVSTLTLVDGELVVTDAFRTPADYERMGLPVADWSMHYPQPDGYVHAMDLRTIGRSGLRSWLTGLYFRAHGFRVLRHVGTADHMHVTLPLATHGRGGRVGRS